MVILAVGVGGLPVFCVPAELQIFIAGCSAMSCAERGQLWLFYTDPVLKG